MHTLRATNFINLAELGTKEKNIPKGRNNIDENGKAEHTVFVYREMLISSYLALGYHKGIGSGCLSY